MRQYDLEDLIQKIENVSLGDVNIATYSQHYPQSMELVETIKTVQRWPRMTDGYHNPLIISLLSLILSTSTININNLNMFSVKLIEKVQLQYALLLQRYLKSVEIGRCILNNYVQNDHFRFTLVEEEANKKFLEGMLLLADVKETNEKIVMLGK